VLLYIERWLAAPVQLPDGSLIQPEKGVPQGAVLTPLTQRKRLIDGQDMADGNFLRTGVHDDFLNQKAHKVFAFRKA
jgi:hypothetical protein